jgi:hypothetical protein
MIYMTFAGFRLADSIFFEAFLQVRQVFTEVRIIRIGSQHLDHEVEVRCSGISPANAAVDALDNEHTEEMRNQSEALPGRVDCASA